MPKVKQPVEQKTVKLRPLPPFGPTATFTEYFYDGEAQCVNGVIEVPANKPEWVEALLNSNYELIADAED